MAKALLPEVSEINPKFVGTLSSNATVGFVPMAAVSESTRRIEQEQERTYREVAKGYTPFRNGDVIVAKITPCFENGKMALVDLEHEYGFGSTEFHVIRPDLSRVDPRYLFHFLGQEELRRKGQARMTGSAGQRRVPKSFYERLEILLLPLAEQRRIAAILDAADALRAKRRAALGKLDALVQAVFLEMFGDPVRNERGWETKKLGEIGVLERGKSQHRPRNAPELLGGPYPLIQTGDIARADGGYIRHYTQTYSEIGLKQSKLWNAGVLCITIAANIAESAILTFDACFPDSVVGFLSGPTVRIEYVQYWLGFLKKTI